MQKLQKQTHQKNNLLTISIVCVLLTVFSVAYALGERTDASMVRYAAQNNCEWVYNGTWYGDNRDYVCE